MNFETYDQWLAHARETDQRTGAFRWKDSDESSGFDYKVIRRRLDELVEIRSRGDAQSLMFYYDEGIHGNMGGMGAPALYRHAASGTKSIISEYICELGQGLQNLADLDETSLPLNEKVTFFRRASQAFGQCALMLSGAGSLGPFHLGVARSLWLADLLPNVISGASAGAIVAAILCSHNNRELSQLLELDQLQSTFARYYSPHSSRHSEFSHEQLSRADLEGLIDTWVPDITFGEALEHSGRHLNISVAPSEVHQQSRTLNPIIAPNVLLREALLATSAVPGVMPPVTLAARSPDGKRTPYVKSRTWVDGSITDDLPRARLRRIYGCNFFITSQTNPMVLWALQDPSSADPVTQMLNIYQSATKEWFRATYPFAMQCVRNLYPMNVWTRMWYSVLTQDYTADVNIIPRRRFMNPMKILAKLPPDEAMSLVHEGEYATWPNIERIRNCTLIGNQLHKLTQRLEGEVKSLGECA